MAVCHKAKMTDSDESFWQGMEQEASDELYGVNGNLLDLLCVTISVCESDPALFEGYDALIGYGHPVRVTAQVFKNVLRTFDRFLHIDHPFVRVQAGLEFGESLWLLIGGKDTRKAQSTSTNFPRNTIPKASSLNR